MNPPHADYEPLYLAYRARGAATRLTARPLRGLAVSAGIAVASVWIGLTASYAFPHLRAVNFVIEGLLGEGVAASSRFDPQAKGLGEWLRSREVELPETLLPAR